MNHLLLVLVLLSSSLLYAEDRPAMVEFCTADARDLLPFGFYRFSLHRIDRPHSPGYYIDVIRFYEYDTTGLSTTAASSLETYWESGFVSERRFAESWPAMYRVLAAAKNEKDWLHSWVTVSMQSGKQYKLQFTATPATTGKAGAIAQNELLRLLWESRGWAVDLKVKNERPRNVEGNCFSPEIQARLNGLLPAAQVK